MLMLVGCGSPSPTTTVDFICEGPGVVVGGQVTFVKRLYGPSGLTGERLIKPVRYGLVEIVDEVTDRVLTYAATDADGNYCLEVPRNPPDQPVYPRAVSRTGARFDIAVVDDESGSLYSRRAGSLDASQPRIYKRDIPLPLFVPLDSGIDFPFSGAYNILDVFITGAELTVELTGQVPPQLFGVWRPGTFFGPGSPGTFFGVDDVTNDAFIVLNGGAGGGPDAGDHDEYDDDVILHEYGHFISNKFSRDSSPGGTHFLNDHTQDIRLSWSEGWATFFSAAVRGSARMVNTYGGDPGSAGQDLSYAFDIERPHSDLLTRAGFPLENVAVYTTSELAVAAVLWDLLDGRNDDPSVLPEGLKSIWRVLTQFNVPPLPSEVTLEAFANRFAGLFAPEFDTFVKTAQLRRIELFPDSFESGDSDNTIQAATEQNVGEVTSRTLYPPGDVDYIKITVNLSGTLTVETQNLRNGADTYLELFDVSGVNLIASNDNPGGSYPPSCNAYRQAPDGRLVNDCPNDQTTFASWVEVPVQPGTYYAKISRSPQRHPATAETGSYDLAVSVN